jgi:hypothetical protein
MNLHFCFHLYGLNSPTIDLIIDHFDLELELCSCLTVIGYVTKFRILEISRWNVRCTVPGTDVHELPCLIFGSHIRGIEMGFVPAGFPHSYARI